MPSVHRKRKTPTTHVSSRGYLCAPHRNTWIMCSVMIATIALLPQKCIPRKNQVFLWGAHKYPRELTWVVGVFLFLCTLGMAFTGQVLRWDQDAYWGLGIGT